MEKVKLGFLLCSLLVLCSCEKDSVSPRDVWIEKAKLSHTYRNNPLGFSINGKGYIGMGSSDFLIPYLNEWFEYDPIKDKWTEKGNFPGKPFNGGVSVATKTKGYVGLGVHIEKAGDNSYTSELLKDIWEYDPSKDTWKVITQFPGNASQNAAAFVIDQKIYISAGYERSPSDECNCPTYSRNFWEYNIDLNRWTQRKSTPNDNFPTSEKLSFSSNNNGFILVYDGESSRNQIWKYDPINDIWLHEPILLAGHLIQDHYGFVIDKSLFLGEWNSFLLRKYDLESQIDDNNYVSNFVGNGTSGQSFVIDNKGYVFLNNGHLWEYNP